jgi:26S proteasome regulatory subunit N8
MSSMDVLHLQVGVEHLLRDINDPSTSSLALQIQQKVNGLTGLIGRLGEIRSYLQKVPLPFSLSVCC